ncbi:T9SS type A sorting domain-containing protein [Halocola ammonii]
MRTFFTVIGFFVFAFSAIAQLDTAMVRTVGGIRNEEARDVIETADGGYLLFGTTGSADESSSKMYLVKISEQLGFEWSQVYGENSVNVGVSISPDGNGNYFLIGHTLNLSSSYDLLVMKVNSIGEIIWSDSYGESDWDFANDAIVLPSGELVIIGETWSFGQQNQVYCTKISSDGEFIWEAVYGGDGFDLGFTISPVPNSTDQFFIGGTTQNESNREAFLALVDAETGEISWQTSETTSTDSGQVILDTYALEDSTVLCAGYFLADNRRQKIIKKFDFDGELLWENILDDDGNQQLNAVTEHNGEILFAGRSDIYGLGGLSMYLLRTNSSGGYSAAAAFGGDQDDFGNDVIVDSQGRAVYVGGSSSYGGSLHDFYLVRIPNVSLVSEYVLDIADYQDEFATEIAENSFVHSEVRVFPNPAKTEITINHGLTASPKAKIYDLSGRIVLTIPLTPTSSTINLETLQAGIYFIRLQGEGVSSNAIKFLKQ